MTEGLGIEGTLDDTTVPDLFRSLIASRETAIVSLDAQERHDTVFFEQGEVISAASSDPDLSLGAVLLKSGDLSLVHYREALEDASTTRPVAESLLARGYLSSEELRVAEQLRTEIVTRDAVRYRSGRYSIDFVSEIPEEVPRTQVDTPRLILDAVRGIELWSIVERGISSFGGLLAQAEGADMVMYELDISEEESHIYSLVSTPLTIEALCERSYLSNFETCRTAVALYTVGLISICQSGEVESRKAITEDELELESLVESYNGVFQSLFRIVSQEIGDYVYDFTDRVVRNVAADRLPFLSGISMTNEARVDYDQLSINLFASGLDDRRSVADDVLNQLLYGWIVETRQEFGDKLQPQVDEVVEPLIRK